VTLSVGTKLGPYEIVAPLGAGGMGEVYKARDTRLERTVAIKVLPPHLSSSEEMRQRFEREAKTISQITHPHICALYDVGREGETEFLVMEYLEGESLADKLARGPLPTEQLLRYGVEVADALDKAHRAGIVHRDLKPGNVMLTKGGVKLLDFGLAKFQAGAVRSTSDSRLATEMQASRPLTERGTVLGTFQYMSPEQLEGKEADGRSDLFAFGAVLYEMATGKKAFTGSSQASLIGSILRDDPTSITEIAPMTPPALNRVVKTCLAKDPEDRFQTAHDVKLQLQWIAEGGSQAGLPAPIVAKRRNREKLAWIVAAAAVVAAGVATFGYLRRTPVRAERIRSYLLPPEKAQFSIADIDGGSLTISPDGRMATFATKEADGKAVLWLQPLGEIAARKLPGTEGVSFPFWSPDSRFLAFFADKKLQKIDVSGGPPLTICEVENGRNGSWNRDGVILYSPDSTTGIFRVPAAGGKPAPATTLDTARGETTQRWVTFLPDGHHFLYMAGSHAAGAKSESNAIFVADLDSKEKTLLLQARSNVAYATGYLLYMREGILMAQRFDPASRRLSGDPVPVAEGVQYDPGYFRGSFAASANDVLLYAIGSGATKTRLRWFDLAGNPLGEPFGEPSEYTNLAISPDEKRIAASIADASTGLPNVWLLDARGARTRLTAGGSATDSPGWSPDGNRIAYAKLEGGRATSVCVMPTAGGKEERVFFLEGHLSTPASWSPDGRILAVQTVAPGGKTKSDIWIVPMSEGGKPYAFLATDADETGPAFSPDGKWLSYISDESGRPELYVVPFPGPGGKWQISTDGVGGGGFSGRGMEILYETPGYEVMSVMTTVGASGLDVGPAKRLFRVPTFTAVGGRYGGDRFILAVPPEQSQTARVSLITNWTAGLTK